MQIRIAAILLSVLSTIATSRAATLIHTPPDLDRHLAETAPGASPLDRLSPPARRRFLADFRGGIFPTVEELDAELTHDEALAILKLFDVEAAMSAVTPRTTHLAIGASETAGATASFATLRNAAAGQNPHEGMLAAYRSGFAPRQSKAALRAMSDGDVALSFRAALAIARDGADSIDPRDLLTDLAELERRGVAAPAWIKDTHAMLVRARDFEGANAFRRRHPDANLPLIPPVRDARRGQGPSVLALADDGHALVRRTIALDAAAQVIVIAGCHFSQDAAHDIENDPVLRSAFARNVVWVTPADYDPADPDLVRWNREHPLAEMSTAYRENEWAAIEGWEMPSFYFLRDGRVERKIIGWQTHRDAVLAGFREIGLVP